MLPVIVIIVLSECEWTPVNAIQCHSGICLLKFVGFTDEVFWFHCSDLGNAQLSGTLVPDLGVLKNLQYLWVLFGSASKLLKDLSNLDYQFSC